VDPPRSGHQPQINSSLFVHAMIKKSDMTMHVTPCKRSTVDQWLCWQIIHNWEPSQSAMSRYVCLHSSGGDQWFTGVLLKSPKAISKAGGWLNTTPSCSRKCAQMTVLYDSVSDFCNVRIIPETKWYNYQNKQLMFVHFCFELTAAASIKVTL
jgi:hypothetical protein